MQKATALSCCGCCCASAEHSNSCCIGDVENNIPDETWMGESYTSDRVCLGVQFKNACIAQLLVVITSQWVVLGAGDSQKFDREWRGPSSAVSAPGIAVRGYALPRSLWLRHGRWTPLVIAQLCPAANSVFPHRRRIPAGLWKPV